MRARITMELSLLEAAHLSDLVGQFEEVVADRDRAQEVRRIVKELHSIGRHDLT